MFIRRYKRKRKGVVFSEHSVIFNMTGFHCNDRGQLFLKMSDCSIPFHAPCTVNECRCRLSAGRKQSWPRTKRDLGRKLKTSCCWKRKEISRRGLLRPQDHTARSTTRRNSKRWIKLLCFRLQPVSYYRTTP